MKYLRLIALYVLVVLVIPVLLGLATSRAKGSEPPPFVVRNQTFAVQNRMPAVNPVTASPTAHQWWHYTDGRPSVLLPLGQYPPEYAPPTSQAPGVAHRPFAAVTTAATPVRPAATRAAPPTWSPAPVPYPAGTLTPARDAAFGGSTNCGSGW
jgi:hypothetical protein